LGLGISDPKPENEHYHSMAEELKSDSVTTRFGVDPDVLRLGLVSFLTDVSSEMIFSVFAIFFTTIAGASSALLGLVEGFADFSASSLDYVAGWWSDKTGRRKAFALVGYGFSTVAKIILLVASSVVALSCFRIIERLGKSFRGPPRDAWLSAIAAKDTRGYSFGVHKALDKAGAVLGPLAAYGLLSWHGETASSFVPAVLSVFVLGLIDDPPRVQSKRESIFVAWKTLSPGVQTLPCRGGDFRTGLFQFRLPAPACE
jgi:MFS family permease